MKRRNIVWILLGIIAILALAACTNPAGGNTGGSPPAGDKTTYTVGDVSFDMIYVPGGLTSIPTGTDDNGGNHNIADGYMIGEIEVTYELWKTVYDWAISNGYTFANTGRPGNDGTEGTAIPNDGSEDEPVTTLNWRDAMVWCNALTEYYNANNGSDPDWAVVYKNGTTIVRDSRDSNASQCDGVTADSTADGFRLPSNNEWNAAARYQNGSIWTPGDHVSGGSDGYSTGSDISDIDTYAVYDGNSSSSTAAVKSKTANQLNIYDMSGNVHEWCFESSGQNRVNRGGSFGYFAEHQQVGYMYTYYPHVGSNSIGLRLARSL